MGKFWIIEHFSSENGLQHLAKELKSIGEKVYFIDCAKGENFDFNRSIPKDSIFFGSQELGEKLKDKVGSIFLGHNLFNVSNYPNFNKLLNQTTFLELNDVLAKKDELFKTYPKGFFIRPDSWRKYFSGQVIKPNTFDQDWKRITFYLTENVKVCLSPLRQIDQEFRLLCIGEELVAGSLYKAQGQPSFRPVGVDRFKPLFNEIKVQGILPDKNCTIDIAETTEGLSLIEFNPLSTSAIYQCDPKSIILALK